MSSTSPQYGKGGRKPSLAPRGRFQTYTVLTVSRSRILADLEGLEILPVVTPKKPRPSDKPKDQTRYCQYHRDFGHTMDECISLKDEIVTLIQNGRLGKYVKRNSKTERR